MKIKPIVRLLPLKNGKYIKTCGCGHWLSLRMRSAGHWLRNKAAPMILWRKRINEGAVSGRELPLLAELDGEHIGLAWGHFEETDPGIAHLYQVWVAPAFRRLGVGQMMLEAVVSWAKEKNTKRLELNVTCGDGSAMRLYVRAGFMPSGRREILRPGSELMSQEMRLDLV